MLFGNTAKYYIKYVANKADSYLNQEKLSEDKFDESVKLDIDMSDDNGNMNENYMSIYEVEIIE